jgi:hypothetical protein
MGAEAPATGSRKNKMYPAASNTNITGPNARKAIGSKKKKMYPSLPTVFTSPKIY